MQFLPIEYVYKYIDSIFGMDGNKELLSICEKAQKIMHEINRVQNIIANDLEIKAANFEELCREFVKKSHEDSKDFITLTLFPPAKTFRKISKREIHEEKRQINRLKNRCIKNDKKNMKYKKYEKKLSGKMDKFPQKMGEINSKLDHILKYINNDICYDYF